MTVKFPPDPAGGLHSLLGTTGQPAQSVGTDGDLATDPNDIEGPALYIKGRNGWKFLGTGTES